MARYLLLTDDELTEIVQQEGQSDAKPLAHYMTSMALELQEYRKIHGPLGCQWLSANEPVKWEKIPGGLEKMVLDK